MRRRGAWLASSVAVGSNWGGKCGKIVAFRTPVGGIRELGWEVRQERRFSHPSWRTSPGSPWSQPLPPSAAGTPPPHRCALALLSLAVIGRWCGWGRETGLVTTVPLVAAELVERSAD